MIRKAFPQEKQEIYRMWKKYFAHDDNGYIDYYFDHRYLDDNTYVYIVDNKIVSTVHLNEHEMMLGNKAIKCGFIIGVATLEDYRHKGYMRKLMNKALEDCESRHIVTLIQGYNPKIYEQFGFKMMYYRKRTSFTKNQIPTYSQLKTTDQFTALELSKIYNRFTHEFDGYMIRNERYFEQYLKEITSEGGKICAYRNEQGMLEGYMVYYESLHDVEIKEMIYANSWAILALLGMASGLKTNVHVNTSVYEAIEKLIPGGSVKEYPFMMARVNDLSVFNVCYDAQVLNSEEAFRLATKPLFIHEYA